MTKNSQRITPSVKVRRNNPIEVAKKYKNEPTLQEIWDEEIKNFSKESRIDNDVSLESSDELNEDQKDTNTFLIESPIAKSVKVRLDNPIKIAESDKVKPTIQEIWDLEIAALPEPSLEQPGQRKTSFIKNISSKLKFFCRNDGNPKFTLLELTPSSSSEDSLKFQK